MKLQKQMSERFSNPEIYETAWKTILQSVFIITGFVCFLPNEARADNFIVKTTNDTIVAGACQNQTSGCSLRGAITAALANTIPDTIFFSIPASDPGCSAGACTINLTQALPTINTRIVFQGPGADVLTVRNSTGFTNFIFNFSGTDFFVMGGLTISDGVNGGIRSQTSGGLHVIGVVLKNNVGSAGSGILVTQGSVLVEDSLITGNTLGTAIHNNGGILRVTNCTVSNNVIGGISNANNGTLTLTNSTVTGNGWIGVQNAANLTFSVKSSIIALNNGPANAPDISGVFNSAGFNLIGKREGSTGFTIPTDLTGTNAAPLDPKLDPAGLRNNGGDTHSIALLPNSPAVDKGISDEGSYDQRGRWFLRTIDYPAVQNAAGGDGTDIGAIERGRSAFDFDGDGRTDVSIFRPAPGEWWVNRSSNGSTFVASFGASTDKIVPGDFTGDGKADIAVFRPGTGQWFILRSEDFSFYSFPFGTNGDVPAPADYDGDGRADPAVFRPSTGTWFILNSGGSGTSIGQFGIAEDKPVAADFDGDRKADIAVFRPSDGSWWYLRSSDSQFRVFRFGVGTDKPVQGDYTGDGKADIAIFRPSTGEWFVQRSENNSFYSVPFGTSGDIPTPGDYDGDGRFDTAVFRPSSATWFVQRSTAGTSIQQFGSNGDLPTPNAFVP